RIGRPHDPDSELLLPPLVHSQTVSRRVPGLKTGRRLEEDVGEHEPHGGGQAGNGGGGEAHPRKRHPLQSGTPGDSVDIQVGRRSWRRILWNGGHRVPGAYQKRVRALKIGLTSLDAAPAISATSYILSNAARSLDGVSSCLSDAQVRIL